jgi:hypothetical protein
MFRPVTLVFFVLAVVPSILAYKDYDNDFLDPSYILAKNFNSTTAASQQSVVEWADFLAAQGPWCKRLIDTYPCKLKLGRVDRKRVFKP